eukprot:CAMPEP_0194033572 /NCGR_PEP_ID=MMETSP0009_2-20130614/6216_1 /TAXON_ID=210454 /ORGANISM="Grammatophora oceanica, Strain CCMP 410" /LENGTH=209 /DNA_ID=CAMNT_0038674287 /DNA_START=37 /DNA_END=666 /DNA_ORIENTATION=-
MPKIILPKPVRAADLLFANDAEKKLYWDRSHYESPQKQMEALAKSKTLYVGNLAFSTRQIHIRTHFSLLGRVREVHMGLDRFRKTPCGFCFVEYARREDALLAVAQLSGTKLDGRIIRVELDAGFQPGRQYGRGQSGGQVRDDRRGTVDPARSGKLKWVPPAPKQQQQNAGDGASGHYGPSSGEKRSREEVETALDRPLKTGRYREEEM